jgi:hypothetical protein
MEIPITDPNTHFIFEGYCYFCLTAWALASKHLAWHSCSVLIALMVAEEIVLSSVAALIRFSSLFIPDMARSIVVYEFYAVAAHGIVAISAAAYYNPFDRLSAGLCALACHGPSLVFLLLFSCLFGFEIGPMPALSVALTTFAVALWSTMTVLLLMRGFCFCKKPR